MDIQYGDLEQLNGLWLIPLCAAATLYAIFAARSARRRFATPDLIGRLLPPFFIGRLCGTTLLACVVLAALAFAMVDVRWGKEWQEVPQQGIELMFVLDVSRSMLAEDTRPNRLTRAKQQISDTIDELAGDRVGLVIFAGEALQEIPLTRHYDDFKQTLGRVDPDSVRRGGSRLGDAIRVATDGFLTKTSDHKAMVILTDGEDQESDPLGAAAEAYASSGVRVFTIGLGDMDEGARIPVEQKEQRTYLRHEGQQVWSKLNGEILRRIAERTDGAYIPAGTKRVNMADVYHGYIANVPAQQFETARINRYRARFQWFLLPALAVIVMEVLWSTQRAQSYWPFRRARRPELPAVGQESLGSNMRTPATSSIGAGLVFWLLPAQTAVAADRHDAIQYNQAVELYRAGSAGEAGPLFESIALSLDDELAAKARFNAGNCHYTAAVKVRDQAPAEAIRQLSDAIADYRSALELDPSDDDARINIELATRLREQLRQREQQPDQQQRSEQQPEQQQQEQPQQEQPQQEQQQQEQQQQEQQQQSDPQPDQQQPPQTGQSDSSDPTNSPDQESQSQSQQSQSPDAENPSQRGDPTDEVSELDAENEVGESAEGDLESAEPSDAPVGQRDGPAPLPESVVEGRMTPEEARKMLQAIRDREMLRQRSRRRAERSRRIPVTKDW